MHRLVLPALALVAILHASTSNAASLIEAPKGSGQQYPGMIAVDPITGMPILLSSQAAAPISGSGGFTPIQVGTSSTPAAQSASVRRFLSFRNESSTATLAVCPSSVASSALYMAGCYTLPPLVSVPWSGSYVPSDAFNAVASAANTPLTVETH